MLFLLTVANLNDLTNLLQIFASVVLLICDRESEEIFNKERPVDEEEGEGEGEGEKEDA